MPFVPLCPPTLSHGGLQGRGAQRSWELLGEVSGHSLAPPPFLTPPLPLLKRQRRQQQKQLLLLL